MPDNSMLDSIISAQSGSRKTTLSDANQKPQADVSSFVRLATKVLTSVVDAQNELNEAHAFLTRAGVPVRTEAKLRLTLKQRLELVGSIRPRTRRRN